MQSRRHSGKSLGALVPLVAALALLAPGAIKAEATYKLEAKISFNEKPPKAGVLYIVGSLKGEQKPAIVDQKNKEFTQDLYFGSKSSAVLFKNSDDVDHNIFANDTALGVKFDIGMLTKDAEASHVIEWQDGEMIKISCKIHPQMKAYVASIASNHIKAIQFDKDSLEATVVLSDIPQEFRKAKLVFPKHKTIEVDLQNPTPQEVAIEKDSAGADQKKGLAIFTIK